MIRPDLLTNSALCRVQQCDYGLRGAQRLTFEIDKSLMVLFTLFRSNARMRLESDRILEGWVAISHSKTERNESAMV
jgi:hypothetical protein